MKKVLLLVALLLVAIGILSTSGAQELYLQFLPFVASSTNMLERTSTDTPVEFVVSQTVTSDIVVTDPRRVAQVILKLNTSARYMYFTRIYLVAPNGQRVLVSFQAGGLVVGPGFIDTYVYNDAPDGPLQHCQPPCTGSYTPYQPLPFGMSAAGVWRLELASQINGSLDNWTLRLVLDD